MLINARLLRDLRQQQHLHRIHRRGVFLRAVRRSLMSSSKTVHAVVKVLFDPTGCYVSAGKRASKPTQVGAQDSVVRVRSFKEHHS